MCITHGYMFAWLGAGVAARCFLMGAAPSVSTLIQLSRTGVRNPALTASIFNL
eukprot:COSAG04_NODE_27975_length_278_cov_1.150838_1_plen_52_part_10